MDGRGDNSADAVLRNYRLGKTLGHGAFGKVKIAEHVLTGYKVAVKILNRRKMRTSDMEEKVRREIKICRLFVHPHIIRLYEVIETPANIYVVMEYVNSGELFDYIVEKGRLQVDEARHFFQQIISGVEYCHKNMVVHRDLKPENLLLNSKGNVKIGDFGLSNIMRDGHFLKTSCGSPNYAAPEVISGKLYAGPEIDVWSCGVVLYALLCGTLPFDDGNIPKLYKKIKGGIYTLPSFLSPDARDLIAKMLVVDPMKRITIPEIRQHHWFKVHLPCYLADPSPDARHHLKKLDEDIIQQVLGMGFDRTQLLESLQNTIQNDATVAYYLLFDHQSLVSSGYLGNEFQESMEACATGIYPEVGLHLSVGRGFSQETSLRPHTGTEKKWLVGLQIKTATEPRVLMIRILGALHELNVRWKKIGHYNLKCLWNRAFQDSESLAANHINDHIYLANDARTSAENIQPQAVLKFEMQVYKVCDEKYLLDLQRVSGPEVLFLDFCAIFAMLLDAS